jgi:hypothetical protein
MPDITAFSPAELAGLLRASTDALIAEVRALGPRATIRPGPDEWCANEIVGHLLEADRRGFAGRIRSVLATERPTFTTWDQPGVARARRDDLRDPAELSAELAAQREADLALVVALDADALGRAGIHPAAGELTVRDLLHEWVHHDREHLAQLTAITRWLSRPFMGNARKFSDPDA